MKTKALFITVPCLLLLLLSKPVLSQNIDPGILKKVKKMSMSELKKTYDDPNMISRISDIKFTLKPTANTKEKWSKHASVDFVQVSFDMEVKYNKLIDPATGEVASYQEILKCVLGKYNSLKWNRLSFHRNDCQDCGDESLIELKRKVIPKYQKRSKKKAKELASQHPI